MPLETLKISILGPFWGPSWGPKSDMLAPRGLLDEVKIIFGPLNLRPKTRSKKTSKMGPGYGDVDGRGVPPLDL